MMTVTHQQSVSIVLWVVTRQLARTVQKAVSLVQRVSTITTGRRRLLAQGGQLRHALTAPLVRAHGVQMMSPGLMQMVVRAVH